MSYKLWSLSSTHEDSQQFLNKVIQICDIVSLGVWCHKVWEERYQWFICTMLLIYCTAAFIPITLLWNTQRSGLCCASRSSDPSRRTGLLQLTVPSKNFPLLFKIQSQNLHSEWWHITYYRKFCSQLGSVVQ